MAELPNAGAIVTGASAGIGREAARKLAAEGADVALVARRAERLEEIADGIEADYDVTALSVPTDVSEPDDVEAAVDRAVEAFGGLDVVVANAGIGAHGPVEELSYERFRQAMGVNIDGMFLTAKTTLPQLRERSGNLIFVGSFAGQYPRPGAPAYAASKWWTRGFAHSLAGQVGDDDVGVTVVNPSEVRTEFGGVDRAPAKERLEPGEVTEPETIADAIVFAAKQTPPDTAQEIDLYRRDKFDGF